MAEKKTVRLLKRTVVKGGRTYHNLLLGLGGGAPIAIDLPKGTFNIKIKCLLLANAEDYEEYVREGKLGGK